MAMFVFVEISTIMFPKDYNICPKTVVFPSENTDIMETFEDLDSPELLIVKPI